ncbi:MAG: response regulator [Chitinivibrionales bacterium]|nr:response regulator [Chitinivibrionales bacterium]MBD3358164.1 response regulator [Chitinivibrionales bacterium]
MVLRPILVVDDEAEALWSVRTVLEAAGCENVLMCESAERMWAAMDDGAAEVIVLDIMMPGVSGEETLDLLRQDYPDIPVIMVTGVNQLETAVRCMRMGAHDYLLKPIQPERLVTAVRHALEIRELERNCEALSAGMLSNEIRAPRAFESIRTIDAKMTAIFRYVEAVAPSSHPILITGETGVGKELIARAIHAVSGRGGRLVPVNVAGFDDTILADTLFGHVKGAFTGAGGMRKGLIEQASGGTLFLDEIGDLSAASQVKLLRLLQEREYLPLGADAAKQTDARIVAATSRTMAELGESGIFRRDLYYRLKTHHVHIPPLRERRDDIPILVQAFLEDAAAEYGTTVPSVPPELFALLGTWHFPGNVRELRGIVFDALAKHRGKILSLRPFKKAVGLSEGENADGTKDHSIRSGRSLLTFNDILPTFKQAESLLLQEALRRAQGNKSLAAGLLGVTRQAISQRLKKAESH